MFSLYEMNGIPYESLCSLAFYLGGGFDVNVLWNNILVVVLIVGAFIFLRSGLGQRLTDALGGLASARKEQVTEKDVEIAKLKLELRTTTQELRQAREFADEDRGIIRTLRSRCRAYVIEINQHRLGKNIAPILAGSEDDV